jgi:hypothetical protein
LGFLFFIICSKHVHNCSQRVCIMTALNFLADNM